MRIRLSLAPRLLVAVTIALITIAAPTAADAGVDPSPTRVATVHAADGGAPAGHAIAVRLSVGERISVRVRGLRPGHVHTVWLLGDPSGCDFSCDAEGVFGADGRPAPNAASVTLHRLGAHVSVAGELVVIADADIPSGTAMLVVRSEGRFSPARLTEQLAGTAGLCGPCPVAATAELVVP